MTTETGVSAEGRQYVLKQKLREGLGGLDLVLTSVAEQTFKIGEIIIDMSQEGISQAFIAEEFKKLPRFSKYSDLSLKELVRNWGTSVHHLKKDYGGTFEEVKAALDEKYNIDVNAKLLRDYRGDINKIVQKTTAMPSLRKKYRDMSGVEKAEYVGGLVEDFAQSHIEEAPRLSQKAAESIEKIESSGYDIKDRWLEVATEYVKSKKVPSIHSNVYLQYLRVLNCTHCDKPRCGKTQHLNITSMPLTGDYSDVVAIPICKPCKSLYESGKIYYTSEEMFILSIKNISMFIEALMIDAKIDVGYYNDSV